MSQKEEKQFVAYVGIDWADEKHDICLQAQEGSQPETFVLKHSPEAIDQWAIALRKRFKNQPIAICLEQTQGPLIYALLKYDFFTLYPVNPQSLAKYRAAFAPSQAKDDPSDAALQLDFLIKHRDRLKAWRADDPKTRSLQRLVEFRKSLSQEKIRLSNKVTSLLKDYFPQILQCFEDKDTQVFYDFMKRWPTLQQARRARESTLEAFFRSHNFHRAQLTQRRIAILKTAIPLTEDEAIILPSSLMVKGVLEQLKVLKESLQKIDQQIHQLCQEHSDYFIFESLPGAGDVYSPRLLVAFGSDRERYASSEDVLKYSGVAPVLERSGKKSWVHWRYACPKFLRQTFVEWAGQSIHHSFWAQLYYQKKRDQGHNHAAATRALAFKWIRIVYRCWQDRKVYDETTYLLALKKQGSPLLKEIELLAN